MFIHYFNGVLWLLSENTKVESRDSASSYHAKRARAQQLIWRDIDSVLFTYSLDFLNLKPVLKQIGSSAILQIVLILNDAGDTVVAARIVVGIKF